MHNGESCYHWRNVPSVRYLQLTSRSRIHYSNKHHRYPTRLPHNWQSPLIQKTHRYDPAGSEESDQTPTHDSRTVLRISTDSARGRFSDPAHTVPWIHKLPSCNT